MYFKEVRKNKISNLYLNIALFVCYILVYVISFSILKGDINEVLSGSKWINSGVDYIFITQKVINIMLPELIFILLSISTITIFMKINNLEVNSGIIVSQMLIFGIILSSNTVVKIIFANTSGIILSNNISIDELWNSIYGMNNFLTGLDLIVNVNSLIVIVKTLICSINVFSVIAFIYLYNKLQKLMKNYIVVLIILIILYLLLTTLFGVIDLSGFISWTD